MTSTKLLLQPANLALAVTWVLVSSVTFPPLTLAGIVGASPLSERSSRFNESLVRDFWVEPPTLCCFLGSVHRVAYYSHYPSLLPNLNKLTTGKSSSFFVPPLPDQGTPSGRRVGGSSRAPNDPKQETALVPYFPNANKSTAVVWGLTASAHPTFWFYIPQPLIDAKLPVKFGLHINSNDPEDIYVYKATLTISSNQEGIISIRIPDTIPALEIGKTYFWTFSIVDDPRPGSHPLTGAVKRVNPNTLLSQSKQSKVATLQEQFTLYKANGIWYDALTSLAELHRTVPRDDPSRDPEWKSLLQSVKLEYLASKPLLSESVLNISEK